MDKEEIISIVKTLLKIVVVVLLGLPYLFLRLFPPQEDDGY